MAIQFAIAGAGLAGLALLFGLVWRLAKKRIPDADSLRRVRNFFAGLGLLLAAALVSLVFFRTLGQFTIAFGVVGAGVAFAAQEVVASMGGGWPFSSRSSIAWGTAWNSGGSRATS